MLSFTTVGMDKLKQQLPPNDPLDLAPLSPRRRGSSYGGRSGTLPTGSNLTSLSTVGNTCGPQTGLWSYGQSSYHGRQEDLEAELEFEDESTARMQSLVPSGLLHDDGRDHADNSPMFPSEVEIPSGTNLNSETESRHQEFLRGGVYQSYARNGFVGARHDQGFDSDRLSNHEGFPGGHVPSPAGGYVLASAEGYFRYIEAIRRANESALPASLKPFVHVASDNASLSYFSGSQPGDVGTVTPHLIREGSQEQLMNFLDREHAFALCKQRKESQEAFYRDYIMERIRAGNVSADSAADLKRFAERENLFQQEGFHHHNLRGLGNSNIEQSSLLERNRAVLINEALASLPNCTYEQGHPTSDAELGNARNEIFEFAWLRNVLNLLVLDARRQAINAELSQRNGFSSPQLTSSASTTAVLSAAPTSSSDSTPATLHPAALHARSRDLRQETSSAGSSVRSRSFRNTPEKKPDGYPSNSYSPPRQKSASSSSPATRALIAQGAKSISVILKPEHSGSRSRSSHPASPFSPESNPASPGSGSLSPIRPRRLNMSNTDALQLIPLENPSLELDVCNQGQFKTELCNNWQESQWCRYGEHCRFAHGVKELRCVLRHHRYKSVPCRMIMSGKECIYGHRCHYRHSLTEKELSLISEAKLVPRTSL